MNASYVDDHEYPRQLLGLVCVDEKQESTMRSMGRWFANIPMVVAVGTWLRSIMWRMKPNARSAGHLNICVTTPGLES